MAATGPGHGEDRAARPSADLIVYRARPATNRPRAGCKAPLSPELDALAERVHRLRPSHRDPEHFHLEKGEIARELRKLARRDG